MTTPPVPIVCDMTGASDTPEERLAEYRHLFATALLDRERTDAGIRFRFSATSGLAEQIRDLAAREKACCAFFEFDITERGGEITWDVSVDVSIVDDPMARLILDELYRLPETAPESMAAFYERLTERGVTVVVDNKGVARPANSAEPGNASA